MQSRATPRPFLQPSRKSASASAARVPRIAVAAALATALAPSPASAHATDQAFVLLLPTELYIASGVTAVLVTVAIIAALPARTAATIFATVPLWPSRPRPGRTATSLLCLLLLAGLVRLGIDGSRDPTRNPLPVAIWTLFWVVLVLLQGALGDLWRWVNPWTGALALARRLGARPRLRIASAVGSWPALASFFGFAAVLLIHPAASDPEDLALLVVLYWMAHFLGGLLCGRRWLSRAEGLTVLMGAYATIAPPGRSRGMVRLGLPGWRALARPAPPVSVAVFMIAMLAVGSFDGLSRTFLWSRVIGQNPLEFEGRTAVILPNALGLAAALPGLAALYAACLWLGVRAAGAPTAFRAAFCAFAPALLPIAFAYHFAHYLPGLLVDIQAVPIVLADPYGTGAGLFGLGQGHVTTGFFNRLDTVRLILLAQAGAVVAGHMLAILLSHAIALRLFGDRRRTALSQVPIAAFMVLYTFFGLWLLASPQGS